MFRPERGFQPGTAAGEPHLARMHRLLQEVVSRRLDQQAPVEQEVVSLAIERGEFLWDAWFEQKNRWEIHDNRSRSVTTG